MSTATSTAYIGLGANLGEPDTAIRQALNALDAHDQIEQIKASSLYRTAPIDASGPLYTNAVARINTTLSAEKLLSLLQALEHQAGRNRTYQNAPRVLDLDLILYDSDVINTDSLIVPHPRMHQRAFVLVPLAELDPTINIPGLGPVGTLLGAVADQHIELVEQPSRKS